MEKKMQGKENHQSCEGRANLGITVLPPISAVRGNRCASQAFRVAIEIPQCLCFGQQHSLTNGKSWLSNLVAFCKLKKLHTGGRWLWSLFHSVSSFDLSPNCAAAQARTVTNSPWQDLCSSRDTLCCTDLTQHTGVNLSSRGAVWGGSTSTGPSSPFLPVAEHFLLSPRNAILQWNQPQHTEKQLQQYRHTSHEKGDPQNHRISQAGKDS